MVVLEDVSWKSGIKWAIGTAVGGLILAVPLVIVLMAIRKQDIVVGVGSRGLEVSAPIRGRYEITTKG